MASGLAQMMGVWPLCQSKGKRCGLWISPNNGGVPYVLVQGKKVWPLGVRVLVMRCGLCVKHSEGGVASGP